MKILILVLILFSFLLFTESAEAKVLPQAKKAIGTKVVKSTGGSGTTIGVSPKLRSDKRALVVSLSNLQNASSVSYLLTYKQGGQQEGAGGSLNLAGGTTQSAELLFGTCSKNVCRYHTNIKDGKLEVSYTLKSGKKYLKRYKIKV